MKIEILIEDFTKELKENQQAIKKTIEKLDTSEAKDEAIHEKVRLNIYEIFETVFNASVKKVYGLQFSDDEALYERLSEIYLNFFTRIPASWRINYEKAKANEDVYNLFLEELKIDTAERIRDTFTKFYTRQTV
ncbi:hypothetical protein [Clostridium manihotivorum]|uniref:Uncharacterized protein n=1 Tax=Clostridium manihotivorum TaxID=2320868 RepID=A0A3R5TFZ5_9CLOT|nr:hypothetical protein [Clostridium manihotivorum]QAA32561.1 hypothetical protein C1I91_13465 [Clostridium manihotivorum]